VDHSSVTRPIATATELLPEHPTHQIARPRTSASDAREEVLKRKAKPWKRQALERTELIKPASHPPPSLFGKSLRDSHIVTSAHDDEKVSIAARFCERSPWAGTKHGEEMDAVRGTPSQSTILARAKTHSRARKAGCREAEGLPADPDRPQRIPSTWSLPVERVQRSPSSRASARTGSIKDTREAQQVGLP
jgi:hypothetical protein